MITIFPTVLLFVVVVFLFFKEAQMHSKRILEEERLANAHVLKEVERFLLEQESKSRIDSSR